MLGIIKGFALACCLAGLSNVFFNLGESIDQADAFHIKVVIRKQEITKTATAVLKLHPEGLYFLDAQRPLNDENVKEVLRNPGVITDISPKFRAADSYPENKNDCVLCLYVINLKISPGPSLEDLQKNLQKIDQFRDKNRRTTIYIMLNEDENLRQRKK